MKQPRPESIYWNAREVASYLHKATSTIYNGGAGTREIPRERHGHQVLWKKSEVIAWAEMMHERAAARLRRRFPRKAG